LEFSCVRAGAYPANPGGIGATAIAFAANAPQHDPLRGRTPPSPEMRRALGDEIEDRIAWTAEGELAGANRFATASY
jgi:hypothetical protein